MPVVRLVLDDIFGDKVYGFSHITFNLFGLPDCHLFKSTELLLYQYIASYDNVWRSMTELLTIKQLHEILKVDRVTLYRMLDDGRLRGIKIGNQWRFPQSELDRLLGGDSAAAEKTDKSIPELPH